MALGKYTRIDNKRSSSSYCSTLTLVVFVALCLVGVWMLTSSSVVPVQNLDVSSEENKSEVTQVKSNENNSRQFKDNPGELPEDATKGDTNTDESSSNNQEISNLPEKKTEITTEEKEEKLEEKIAKESTDEENKSQDSSQTEKESGVGDFKTDGETNPSGDGDSGDNSKDKSSDQEYSEKKSDSDESENKSDERSDEIKDEKLDGQIEEKVEQNKNEESEQSSGEKKKDSQNKDQVSNEVFPSGAQSELLNETTTQNGSWSTQAVESKNEKEAQQSSESKEKTGFSWKLCNVTAGPDYIPCLDNLQA